jgi:hypothetical protein
MRSRVRWLLRTAIVASLLAGASSVVEAQENQASEIASFFEALEPVLESNHVFAVDAESFAEILGESLGWTVSAEDVEASLGANLRFGRLFRFLACEAYVDCIVAGDGAHVALAHAEVDEGSEEVELYLIMNTTENLALTRHRESLTLRRTEGEWHVVGSAGVGMDEGSHASVPAVF